MHWENSLSHVHQMIHAVRLCMCFFLFSFSHLICNICWETSRWFLACHSKTDCVWQIKQKTIAFSLQFINIFCTWMCAHSTPHSAILERVPTDFYLLHFYFYLFRSHSVCFGPNSRLNKLEQSIHSWWLHQILRSMPYFKRCNWMMTQQLHLKWNEEELLRYSAHSDVFFSRFPSKYDEFEFLDHFEEFSEQISCFSRSFRWNTNWLRGWKMYRYLDQK